MDTTIDAVIDTLHAAGHFDAEIAAAARMATVKCGNSGGSDFWWACCLPCWWWSEEDDARPVFVEAEAQALADKHNRKHHGRAA